MKKEMKQQRKNKIPRIASLALMLTMVTTCLLSGTLAKYTKTVYGEDTARVAKFDFAAGIKTNNDTNATALTTTTPVGVNLFGAAYQNAGSVDTVKSTNNVDQVVAPGTTGYFAYEFTGTSEVSVKLAINISEDSASSGTVPIFFLYDGKYYANAAAYTHYSIPSTLKTDAASTSTNLWIDIRDGSGSTPIYIELYSGNFGGNLTDLAAASATAISTNFTPGTGVIPPNTNLADVTTAAKAASNDLTKVTWYWPYEVATTADGGATFVVTPADVKDTALGVDAATATPDEIILNMNATATQVD